MKKLVTIAAIALLVCLGAANWVLAHCDSMAAAVSKGIKTRFSDASGKKQVAEESVGHGREYVEAYVQLTHFIETIHHTVSHGAIHKHQVAD